VGLICLQDTETCAAAISDGGACTDATVCGVGFTCLGLRKNTPGTCTPNGGVGDACDDAALMAPHCDANGGSFCERGVRDAGICQPIIVNSSGSACGDVSGVTTVCGTGGLCVKSDPDGGSGSCVAYVIDGNSCDSVAGPPCLPPAKCVPTTDGGTAGTCTLANGTSCQ
jgi:hypothetical protein